MRHIELQLASIKNIYVKACNGQEPQNSTRDQNIKKLLERKETNHKENPSEVQLTSQYQPPNQRELEVCQVLKENNLYPRLMYTQNYPSKLVDK